MPTDIPIQEFVRADITITALPAVGRDFGLPIFMTDENTPGIDHLERVRRYSSLQDVAVDWNSTDEVYVMAQTAFSQRPAPENILIGVYFTTDQAGKLECATLADGVDVDTFKAVTDGSVKVFIDGNPGTAVTALDFSTDTTLTEVAARISAATTGATCTFDITRNRFIFTSDSFGNDSSINYLGAVGSGTELLGAAFLNGAVGSDSRIVNGLTVGSLTDELGNVLAVNDEAYFIAIAENGITYDDKVDVAEWVEALENEHQYFVHSNEQNLLLSNYTTDLASRLQGLSLSRTFCMYSGFVNEYPEVSVLARAATVNWSGENTAITLAFKTLPGITPENATGIGSPAFRSAQLAVVNSKNCNAYATVGISPKIVSNAMMSNGFYQDEVHFKAWLKNNIETRVYNIIASAPTKVPYTEPGLNQIQAGIVNALEQGVRNGGLSPAIDADGNFRKAYRVSRIPVSQVDPVDKQSRIYKGFSFIALMSGAIHKVKPIVGTLTLTEF